MLAIGMFLLGAAQSGPVLAASGAPLDLSAYKGKVVYLDFWASWCNPCRQSFPWMNDIQQTYGKDGLVVIAVNVDHDHGLAENFLQDNSANFKVVFDPDGQVAGKYDIRDMPTSVLIGRDGKVHDVHNGFYLNKEDEYREHIQKLLSQKAS
ncbi:MAG: TlpA family protein disulfide reductase [Alphaproteobacteria bacterium]|nr:TlpA family protein disulfide reductase [Alphaproteobacteria bacterium]MDE2011781.1 TlpA family protein disulfide reductase [Alphaproteobacteria bacterium]MDE2073817.1 TlpA family protein disulfide reductase [Alphaproteobacteria bacterium]MDE2351956.1 TlpA family protein disulfide reductase [Alphaproteobacteria bacterium]